MFSFVFFFFPPFFFFKKNFALGINMRLSFFHLGFSSFLLCKCQERQREPKRRREEKQHHPRRLVLSGRVVLASWSWGLPGFLLPSWSQVASPFSWGRVDFLFGVGVWGRQCSFSGSEHAKKEGEGRGKSNTTQSTTQLKRGEKQLHPKGGEGRQHHQNEKEKTATPRREGGIQAQPNRRRWRESSHTQRRGRKAAPPERTLEKQHRPKEKETKQHHPTDERRTAPQSQGGKGKQHHAKEKEKSNTTQRRRQHSQKGERKKQQHHPTEGGRVGVDLLCWGWGWPSLSLLLR